MKTLRPFAYLAVAVLSVGAARPALALANRVFVSARSGNNANSCDNINTPCQTFAGAVTQLNPNGEVIVLDSGGYGPVTITQAVTIEAPAGVTAFIHPPSGDAITINTGATDKVTLRGLTLNVGFNGIVVNSVGTLIVENCFITGFIGGGILMSAAGRLNVKGTDITGCSEGIYVSNTTGLVEASIDRCHLDGNTHGFFAQTTSPGQSKTTATNSTASHNESTGWICGASSSGQDVLNLEFCTGSHNAFYGVISNSNNSLSVVRYSNCVFSDNVVYGVFQGSSGVAQTRGNNTITGNGAAPTTGAITSFSSM
jgi:hypothetical protein